MIYSRIREKKKRTKFNRFATTTTTILQAIVLRLHLDSCFGVPNRKSDPKHPQQSGRSFTVHLFLYPQLSPNTNARCNMYTISLVSHTLLPSHTNTDTQTHVLLTRVRIHRPTSDKTLLVNISFQQISPAPRTHAPPSNVCMCTCRRTENTKLLRGTPNILSAVSV